jgi:hypothetical protein
MFKKLICFLKTNIPENKKPNNKLLWEKMGWVQRYRQNNKIFVHHILDDLWTEKKPEIVKPEIITNRPIDERRANVRMGINSILLDSKNNNIVSINTINGRITNDELSNISLWWLQIFSRDSTKKIWDIIDFKFKLGVYKFSLKWEVSNIVKIKENGKTKYWIKFINIPKEQQIAIQEILGSIKLYKL